MLTDDTPGGWVALHDATHALGISRQTILQKVKRGELRAVLDRTGRMKGLRIELPRPRNTACSNHAQSAKEQYDHGSKHASMSASSTQRYPWVPSSWWISAIASCARRSGTEPVRARLEIRLEDGLQHQLQARLDHAVGHGRDGRSILPLLQPCVGLDLGGAGSDPISRARCF